MAWLMDEADVCRTSSRASRRPPDVISTAAILNPRWRRRKWHQPGLGVLFSIPVVAVAQNGGPSASGRHLGWPHLREPEMRSSKMAAGSGRAAILRHRHNGDRKKYPILLAVGDYRMETHTRIRCLLQRPLNSPLSQRLPFPSQYIQVAVSINHYHVRCLQLSCKPVPL